MILYQVIVALILNLATHNTKVSMFKIRTPDENSFEVSIVEKNVADSLQQKYGKKAIDDPILAASKRYAYLIEDGQILYRQFYKDIGYLFPSKKDYEIGISGDTYFRTSIQPVDTNNLAVGFWLKPVAAGELWGKIKKEITSYERFEGFEFYMLKDNSVAMLKKRTELLSDGFWFNSERDFDFFYYILSGKEKSRQTKNEIE